jgi:7-carboxy-7-deazaguanine synthase
VKFVICDRRDYEWSRDTIKKYDLTKRAGAVLMGAVTEMAPGKDIAGTAGMSMRDLAEWILEDRLPVRIQSQLHKWIWDPMARGV